ncbi:MAG: hypothetical protein U5N53_14770 [Mycobacterium sp.]|nr:hypothetical protein [Mycobacterium sp.]
MDERLDAPGGHRVEDLGVSPAGAADGAQQRPDETDEGGLDEVGDLANLIAEHREVAGHGLRDRDR